MHLTGLGRNKRWVIGLACLVFQAQETMTGRALLAQQENRAGTARYELEITVRPDRSRLEGRGVMSIGPFSHSQDTIKVLLSSWMTNVRFELIEPGGFASAALSTDSVEGDRTWRLAVPKSLPAGVPVTLKFDYSGDSIRSAQLRVTPEGSLAGGSGEIWYPRLAFDSNAVGTLRFHVPPGETVLSTGALDSARSNRAQGVFVFNVSSPSKFGFASAKYVSYESGGTFPVTLLLLKPRENAKAMLDKVVRIMSTLSAEFGKLPLERYAVAEVEFGGSVAGTSEFGFFLANRSAVDQGLPIPFIAHELGHAWWGNLIGTLPGPGRMMLTEGIASFGMLRAIEQIEGPSSARAYRRSSYPGYEKSGSPREYFNLAAAGIEKPVASLAGGSQKELLTMHRMANTRGWFLYDMLSREIGRARFAAILRGIVGKYSGGALSWKEFRSYVEQHVGKPIGWFFDDWFDRTGAPDYRLSWSRTAHGVSGSITQDTAVYRATVPVTVFGANGQRISKPVFVAGQTQAFNFTVPFRVYRVLLDPEFLVLRWDSAMKRSAKRTAPLSRADFERRFGSMKRALELYFAALDSVAEPDTAGLRFSITYGLAAALISQSDTARALKILQDALREPVRAPDQLPLAYILLARIAYATHELPLAQWAAAKAVTADEVTGNRIGALATVKGFPWYNVSAVPRHELK